MSEQTIYEDRNDASGGSTSPQKISFEPNTLNLRKLQSIQKFFQYAAGLVFLLFLGLIGLSYWELRNINKEIESKRNKINNQEAEIKINEEKIRLKKKMRFRP